MVMAADSFWVGMSATLLLVKKLTVNPSYDKINLDLLFNKDLELINFYPSLISKV